MNERIVKGIDEDRREREMGRRIGKEWERGMIDQKMEEYSIRYNINIEEI